MCESGLCLAVQQIEYPGRGSGFSISRSEGVHQEGKSGEENSGNNGITA